jgi:hypothetical protein
MWPLRAEGGVVTMTRMHDRVIVEAVEDLGFQIIHERRELCGTIGLAGATGEAARTGTHSDAQSQAMAASCTPTAHASGR